MESTDASVAARRLAEASDQLKLLVQQDPFPELRAPIAALSSTVESIITAGSTEPDAATIVLLEKNVENLYRASVAQTNASPQKYQQPIFQCYSDYQKCVSHNKSKSGKGLCLSLFILSIAHSLVSISVTFKK
jgi:hypothetical protein